MACGSRTPRAALVRNVVGIEWSAQFCADPAKVDRLRVNARRLYAGFPEAAEELGIRGLLDTPITDAAGVQRWTDSICNASVPLPAALHTGVLPGAKTGGIHHYPSPIAEIALIKRDDFDLWVRGPNDELVAPSRWLPAGRATAIPGSCSPASLGILTPRPRSSRSLAHRGCAWHQASPCRIPPSCLPTIRSPEPPLSATGIGVPAANGQPTLSWEGEPRPRSPGTQPRVRQ